MVGDAREVRTGMSKLPTKSHVAAIAIVAFTETSLPFDFGTCGSTLRANGIKLRLYQKNVYFLSYKLYYFMEHAAYSICIVPMMDWTAGR
jgi:hypothetical protein